MLLTKPHSCFGRNRPPDGRCHRPRTPTAASAITVAAAAAARAVGVGGVGRQTVSVLRRVDLRTRSDADARARQRESRRTSTKEVSSCVKTKPGPVLPLASRTDSCCAGSWDSTSDAVATICAARSVPKCPPSAHRCHAVDTSVQEGSVLRDARRNGTGLSRPGRGCHRVCGWCAQEPPGRRSGVSPSFRSRGSLSTRKTPRKGESLIRMGGGIDPAGG